MGLSSQSLRWLIQTHTTQPLESPLLTLGRQDIIGGYAAVLQAFTLLGVAPLPLTPEIEAHKEERPDRAFFGHLGVELHALDYSDYEGAELVHDLNEPIPPEWAGRYRTILDGGTLEHVFDVRQALRNTGDLLAVDGRVIHFSPLNNYVNHGFWQFSPTLFFDFYQANNYASTEAVIAAHHRDDPYNFPWTFVAYNHDEDYGMSSFFNSVDTQLFLLFIAKKEKDSTSHVIPTQKWYRQAYKKDYPPKFQRLFEYTPYGIATKKRIFVFTGS